MNPADPPYKQVRAVYDAQTIRVYQAYNQLIADAALRAGRFVEPFGLNRMSWIKPSFLWMMYRCGWSYKDSGQRRVLAIDMTREGFEWALRNSSLSHEKGGAAPKPPVRVQWDPERDLHLERLEYRSIQIGLSGEALRRYIDSWITEITDITEHVRGLKARLDEDDPNVGNELPQERPYPLPPDIEARLCR